jgi:hypothetical protein
MNTITGTVSRVERKGHTVYGNPIKIVHIEGNRPGSGVFRISDNASLAYQIENGEFRDQPHTFALTRAGRISHVIRA